MMVINISEQKNIAKKYLTFSSLATVVAEEEEDHMEIPMAMQAIGEEQVILEVMGDKTIGSSTRIQILFAKP